MAIDQRSIEEQLELTQRMLEDTRQVLYAEREQLAAANAEIERLQLALTQIVTIANSSKEVTSYIKHMVDMFTIAEAALKSPTES